MPCGLKQRQICKTNKNDVVCIATNGVFIMEDTMESIWQANTKLPEFPKLERDMKTDVLIIGGGIAGILTAYFLHQNGGKIYSC